MKKIALIFIAVFMLTGLSFGQFTLGVRVGYNGNKLATDLASIKTQFGNGFHVGIFTRIGKRFYVAPELNYMFSGGTITNDSANASTTWTKQKYALGTLDIPILLGFKLINSGFLKWRLELGPVGSFVVNKKVKDFDDLTGPVTTADFNTANWLIMVGTGLDISFLTIDVRYQYAFNSLLKDVKNYTFDAHPNMIIVSLGFKFIGNK